MPLPKDPFRQFQEELAALEREIAQRSGNKPPAPAPAPVPAPEPVAPPAPVKRMSKKAAAAERLAMIRAEFLAFRDRYELTVADVVAFFPPEEGIAYLEQLIAASQNKPRRGRKPKALSETPEEG
ncbi:MAG TPA: 2-hydroxyacyl-CoA dehydratase [Dyella sp.]